MYKLLVVDDECMITDLLCEYLQQKLEEEMEILKAYSGKQAVEIMDHSHIDILLTDINMPGITGIDLHKKARQANPACKIIFLTGYNSFEKIQYALRNESVDFILKTESYEVILNSISKAAAEFDSELSIERMLSRAQDQLRLTLPIVHERLILSLLDGEASDLNSFKEADFPLRVDKRALMLLGHADNGCTASRNEFYRLKNLVDGIIGTGCEVFSVVERNDILWLIQPDTSKPDAAFELVRTKMDQAQKMCSKVFNISISMVLSQEFIPFEDIPYTWHALKQAIKNLHGLSDGMQLIEKNSAQEQRNSKSEWLDIRNIMQNIQVCVDSLQRDNYDMYYGKLSRLMSNSKHISSSEKMEVVTRLYLAFLSNANSNGLKLDIRLTDYIAYEESWDAYDSMFKDIAEKFFAMHSQSSFRNTNQILGNIKNYIHANLGGDVSLNRLAEIAHFTPAYLSRLFRQVTDTNLTEYIGRLKFERAAQLLKDSDMKIADVAVTLGFEVPSYFTRFFKKYALVSPQEYREIRRQKKITE